MRNKIENALENKLYRMLYKQAKSVPFIPLINAVILTILLNDIIPAQTLHLWLLLNIIVSTLRYILAVFCKIKTGYIYIPGSFRTALLFSIFAAGIAFGSSAILFDFKQMNFAYQLFLYFVIGGMLAGAVSIYSVKLNAYLIYTLSVIIPITVRFLYYGESIHVAMIIAGCIFYFILIVSTIRNHKQILKIIRLNYKNRFLTKKVIREKKIIQQLNRKLKKQVLKDPLTGLNNRRFLKDIVRNDLEKFLKHLYKKKEFHDRRVLEDTLYGIFMIDLDHFKDVNDSYGHDSGDMVLVQFSRLLLGAVRAEDIVIRLGGEEFLIILKKTKPYYIPAFAEKLRKLVEKFYFKINSGNMINITCSIGTISFPVDISLCRLYNFQQSISLCDKALYHAKKNGRNKSVQIVLNEKYMGSLKNSHTGLDQNATVKNENEYRFLILTKNNR